MVHLRLAQCVTLTHRKIWVSEFILATRVLREAELHRKLASECGYQTDRDVAASQVVKNRGLLSISADGQSVLRQNACGEDIGLGNSKKQEIQKVIFGIPHYKHERFVWSVLVVGECQPREAGVVALAWSSKGAVVRERRLIAM